MFITFFKNLAEHLVTFIISIIISAVILILFQDQLFDLLAFFGLHLSRYKGLFLSYAFILAIIIFPLVKRWPKNNKW